ncbi:MAG: polyprenyl synthetase family protein [Clostridiales bacterium]|nr:polyprenyl synthetase family protein [Clostridiales bacterium]
MNESFYPSVEYYVKFIDQEADRLFPKDQGIVCDAMKYSLENGGKRIRPMLTLEFCRICSGDHKKALPFALAVEMIHTYSLIHDDLPCMDDDDIRRGKPSCHKKFGEEYALLAGDGLLTEAFKVAVTSDDLTDAQKSKAVSLISEYAGYRGMIGGQMFDLQNEGRTVSLDRLKSTCALKTGAMIKLACQLGCIAANADEVYEKAAVEFAENIGLGFQIVDDILDVTSSTDELGKPVGSDEENQKCTYVSVLGLEKAQKYADELTEKAKKALDVFGGSADFLLKLADSLLNRKK